MADATTQRRRVNRPTTHSVDWLRWAALVGLCVDAATTWQLLAVSGHRELNPILVAFWSYDPAVVAGYFAVFVVVVWGTTRRRNWLSTTISTSVLVIMGVFGGLNNLGLFVFGSPSLLELLAASLEVSAATVIVVFLPVFGVVSALAVASVRHGRIPWRGTAAVIIGGALGYLVYLSAAQAVFGIPTVLL